MCCFEQINRNVHHWTKVGLVSMSNQNHPMHFLKNADGNHRQINRTKENLRHAFLDLIRVNKDYDSISLKQILDKANVGRSTFYSHYQNKDELLLEAGRLLQNFLEHLQKTAVTTKDKPYEKIIGFSLAWFEHASQERLWPLYRFLLGPKGGWVGRQLTQESLRKLFAMGLKTQRNSSIPTDLLVVFLSDTFLAVSRWWVEQKNPLSPQKIDAYFRSLILPVLKTQLG